MRDLLDLGIAYRPQQPALLLQLAFARTATMPRDVLDLGVAFVPK